MAYELWRYMCNWPVPAMVYTTMVAHWWDTVTCAATCRALAVTVQRLPLEAVRICIATKFGRITGVQPRVPCL